MKTIIEKLTLILIIIIIITTTGCIKSYVDIIKEKTNDNGSSISLNELDLSRGCFDCKYDINYWKKNNTSIKPLRVFPELICKQTNLKKLNLKGHDIESIPDCISNLNNLETLDLSGNPIKYISEEIGSLKKLNTLFLNVNSIDSFPINIEKLVNLKEFKIRLNKSQFPKNFDKLKKIPFYLNLSNNNIDSLPDILFELDSLYGLDLSLCELKRIPEKILKLKNLKYLNLSNNQLNELNKSLCELENLEILDISNYYPDYNFSNDGTGRRPMVLDIYSTHDYYTFNPNKMNFNVIQELPECICNLKNLRKLKILTNELKSLPDCIGNLTELVELDLSDDVLQHPNFELIDTRYGSSMTTQTYRFIGTNDSLSYVEEAKTGKNNVLRLPESIKNCKKLRTINVKYNNIPKEQIEDLKNYIKEINIIY